MGKMDILLRNRVKNKFAGDKCFACTEAYIRLYVDEKEILFKINFRKNGIQMMRVNSERGGSGLTVISISLDIGCLTKDSSVYHFLIAVKVEIFTIILMFMVFLLSYLSHKV